jgi:hypothetical protein
MPVSALALDRTFALPFPFEDVESAEVGLTFKETDVVLADAGESADVVDAGVEMPLVEAALSSAFPEVAAAPDPAPDDEPAVFDATAVGPLLIDDDWM